MIEIEVSTIPDAAIDNATMQTLIDEFCYTHNAKVKIRQMTWATAWTELFSIASNRKGPDVSHIGGTWVSSLSMMKALRPFKRSEIEVLGGSSAFLAPTCSSTKLQNEEVMWAIPWTGYIYVICYRKDLLKQAGIDESKAFTDTIELKDTVLKLRNAGAEIPWLNPMIVPPYVDYIHTAASWVWSAGGDFLDPVHKKHVVLDSPEARKGLVSWLETYVCVADNTDRTLPIDIAMNLFAQGHVAAVLTDIRTATSFMAGNVDETVSKNLGAVALTQTPWCGGGSFVVWDHIQIHPERERLAVAFVQFMTSKKNSIVWEKQVGSMPARMDALNEIYPDGHPLHNAITLANQHGRSYPSVPVWRRIEYQIAQTLSDMLGSAYKDGTQNLDVLVHNSITPLVRRLNLALEG